MVDDNEQQPRDESSGAAPEAPSEPAPRRRRRAASRPAGPPAPSPDVDQAELFLTATQPEEAPAPDEAPAPESSTDDAVDGTSGQDPSVEEADATDEESAPEAQQQAEPQQVVEPEVPVAPQRRSRRATRGVTTVAFSAVEEPEPAGTAPAGEAPAVALFQAPDETRAVRRTRRPRSQVAKVSESVEAIDAAGSAQSGDGSRADDAQPGDSSAGVDEAAQPGPDVTAKGAEDLGPDAQAAEDAEIDAHGNAEGTDGEGTDAEGSDADERSDDGAPRRRRRRGGRRRRRPGSPAGEDNESGEENEPGVTESGDQEPVEQGSEAGSTAGSDTGSEAGEVEGDDADGDEGSESSSARRRRRRRRRAGVAEEMEDLSAEDPPNTVVKVREARRPRDEITSVRGSTRIEAKKQRRRDGREAGRRRAPILTEAEFLARREAVNRVMCVREHGDRTQIAVLEDGVLVEHYVNRAESSSLVGNVYLGKVQNVLPSMEAAFVDIGRGRNAVLYAGEVNWDAAGLEGQPKRIELAMKSGDPVLVQVTKDPIGHKGARLTSQVSLPGRFLVYVPEGSMTGISRKLPDTERARLKSILKDLVPDGAGVIVRTAAEGASEEQLTADVTRLAAQWADITKKAKSASPPSLLYGEPDLAIKVVRDIFNEDFTTLLVQGESTHRTLGDYIGRVAPDLLPKVSLWAEPGDLYAAHRIDEQLAKALDRKVWLPSGGSLVIDRTEAMTVVDVNTGKFTGQGGNLEETVTRNNLEAAEEIVRQLRLRDIGGIIVVDFIDMVLENNRDLVLRRLVECLGRDRTKHQVAEVTSLGLVQMTRKRIGQGLLEVFSTQCEHCAGRGYVVSSEPVGIEAPSEEPTGRRDRGGRRASQKAGAPAVLGGKQTGKTPPPPKFDQDGRVEHEAGGEHVQTAQDPNSDLGATADAGAAVDAEVPVEPAPVHADSDSTDVASEPAAQREGGEGGQEREAQSQPELESEPEPQSESESEPQSEPEHTDDPSSTDAPPAEGSPEGIDTHDQEDGPVQQDVPVQEQDSVQQDVPVQEDFPVQEQEEPQPDAV